MASDQSDPYDLLRQRAAAILAKHEGHGPPPAACVQLRARLESALQDVASALGSLDAEVSASINRARRKREAEAKAKADAEEKAKRERLAKIQKAAQAERERILLLDEARQLGLIEST